MDFQSWLDENKDEIEQAQEFSKSDLPKVPEQIQPDLNRTTREYPRIAVFVADVERFLLEERARETLSVHRDKGLLDLSAPERKMIVEARVSPIIHTLSILKATAKALEQRHFALLNQRNSVGVELRMAQHQEG